LKKSSNDDKTVTRDVMKA